MVVIIHKFMLHFTPPPFSSTRAAEGNGKTCGESFRGGESFSELRLYCRKPDAASVLPNDEDDESESRLLSGSDPCLPGVRECISEIDTKLELCQSILLKQRLVNVLLVVINLVIVVFFYNYSTARKC